MVRTNLRHFLLVTLLLIANITTAATSAKETSAQSAYQEKMHALHGVLLSIQQMLSEEQFDCLQTIVSQYQAYINLLLIDEKTETAAFDAFLAVQGQKLSKEELISIKKTMLIALEQQKVPLPIAQKFFATLIEMRSLQQQFAGQTDDEDENVDEDAQIAEFNETIQGASHADKKTAQITQVMFGSGPFARLFLLDTEKDAAKVSSFLTQAKKINIIPAEVDAQVILNQVKEAKETLLKNGATQEDMQAVFDEMKAKYVVQIAQQFTGLQLPTNLLTIAKENLEPVAKELSKKHGQEITVDMVFHVQQQLKAQKLVFGITAKEIQASLAIISAEHSKEFWRKYALAALTATTMGTADLLIQTPKHIAKASGSILNKIFGTTVFYSEENENKISLSKEGIAGRLLQLVSTYPAGILYKENSFDKLFNTQDPTLQMPLMAIGQQYPILKKTAKVAPFLLVSLPRQKQATVDNAFAEICGGSRRGAASSIAFQKFAPLAVWIGIQAYKNKAILESFGNFRKHFTQDDKSNAWSSAAFAAAPLFKDMISSPIDNALGNLAPKDGVFWRSLLSSGWASRLVEIGYQSAMRHQLWKQHNGHADDLWVRPDFGKTLRKTTRTIVDNQGKTREETFAGSSIPAVKADAYNMALVKSSSPEAHLPECDDIHFGEVLKCMPTSSPVWKKEESLISKSESIVQGAGSYSSANDAAFQYAKKATTNLVTEQLTKTALVSACFAFNKKIATLGKNIAQKAASAAYKIGLIKESTHNELKDSAKNIQESIHMVTGLWAIAKNYVHNPNEILQNPEVLAKVMERVTADGAKALSPQTQMLQLWVHRQFINKLYQHLLQKGLNKVAPNWFEESTESQAPGIKTAKFLQWMRPNTTPEGLAKTARYANASLTAGKLAAYTTLWLAATAILSYKDETAKPTPKKKPVKPKQKPAQPAPVEQPEQTPAVA